MNTSPYIEDHPSVGNQHIPSIGTRIIVYNNREWYATAFVMGFIHDLNTNRKSLVLAWPNTPNGPSNSEVLLHDEGIVWNQYNNVN